MKTSWSPKSFLLLALLARPAFAGTDSAVLVVRPDATLGTLQVLAGDASRLSGWIWAEPGGIFGIGDTALVRIVARDGPILYVDPYPADDQVSRIAVEEDPLLLQDGFEAGSFWFWSSVEGPGQQDVATEAQSRMAATSVKWFVVDHLIGLDSGGSEVDVLLSERIGGGSASTDTPASVPFRPVLRDPDPVDWEAIRTASGWPDIGGVLKHAEYVVTANNRRLRSTRVGPLDDLAALNFKDQAIVRYAVRKAWNSSAKRWEPQSLANSTILWKGTLSDGSFSGVDDNSFSYRIREQTTIGLAVTAAPERLRGLGGGVIPEDGGGPSSGARVSRPDHSGLRGTGDQWFAVGVVRFGSTEDAGSAEYTWADSPLFRLRRDVTSNLLKAELRNAAGTWQTVGTSPTFTFRTYFGVLVNYDQSSTTAELWVNGVSAGSTVITSGLYASAASAATTFYSNPSSGSMEFRIFFFRHGTRLLADAEIEDRSLYVFDFESEVSLDCALEFNERTGTEVGDFAQTQSASLVGFADANGAWVSSASGEAAQSRSYPYVFLGQPFMAQALNLDLAFRVYTPGFEHPSGKRDIRSVVADGARLDATISTTKTTAWDAAVSTVSIAAPGMLVDPGLGQTLNFDSGTNVGNHVITGMVEDPITGDPATHVYQIAAGFAATESVSGLWTGTGEWDPTSAVGTAISSVPGATVATGATERMAFLLATASSRTEKLVSAFLEFQGPKAAPTETNLAALDIDDDYGWQGDGAAAASVHADTLARVTPSADYGPSVVWRNSSGTWQVTGSDLSPASATYTWDASRIASATVSALPGEYDAVRVLYAKAWSPLPDGAVPQPALIDRLAREAAVEWREVTSGSGSKILTLETYFLKRVHAQSFADAIYSMLSGALYAVDLNNPGVKPAEAAMAPLTVVDVTWPGGDLAAGAKGIVAAWKVNPDKSARALVFFGS